MDRTYRKTFDSEDQSSRSERLKIGVFGLHPGAGASFLATSVAWVLASRRKKAVAFVELGPSEKGSELLFEAAGMGQRFSGRAFMAFHRMVRERKYIHGFRNLDCGVNWALHRPGDRENPVNLTELEATRLAGNIHGDWIVCDLGSQPDPGFLTEMDVLLAVVDPLPSRILASASYFRKIRALQARGLSITWVVNRHNKGVDDRLLRKTLRLGQAVVIPMADPAWFYMAQYRCRLPIEQPEIRRALLPLIEDLVHRHIPITWED